MSIARKLIEPIKFRVKKGNLVGCGVLWTSTVYVDIKLTFLGKL